MSRKRRWTATFARHNGNRDAHNNPTYGVPTDWALLPNVWPCEVVAGSGGEVIRGRQVTESSTHVFFGEYGSAGGIETTDRLILNDGRQFSIVHVSDQDGFQRQRRIECKYEK